MLDKVFFQDYYYNQLLSFKKISEKTGYSVGILFRAFHKLGLKPIKHNQWNKGKNCFKDNRILSGENHPRWIARSKYLIEFKLKRKELINGINKCSCGKIANILHHKDKNTFNNNDNNLLMLCSSCHTILHNKERGITVYKHKCDNCDKEFTVLHNRKCNQKFCSLSCKSKYQYDNGINPLSPFYLSRN
jgi:hypothetical protein